jgi:hypothetical protein
MGLQGFAVFGLAQAALTYFENASEVLNFIFGELRPCTAIKINRLALGAADKARR